MKILVASINFAPDHSGIALYSTDLPVFFAEQGHDVTMVTGFPYYPGWKKRHEDQGKLFEKEQYRGVTVLRGYLYVPRNVTTLKRIVHELSFSVFALFNCLRAGRHDCIVVLSPPLLLGLIGIVGCKWLWRSQMVFHIQDLQPDAALSLGMVKPGLMIRTLSRIEAFIYRHSTWIATITKGMSQRLVEKGVPENKIAIYPNWLDIDEASQACEKGTFRAQHPDVKDKFLVAYAGNIGMKQGVESLLDLATTCLQNPKVHFFVIGEGADKPRLMAQAADLALQNVTFLPFMGQERYREMLEDVDCLFVSQRSGTGNVFFPSKLLGIMAKSKPLLVSADTDSELSKVIAANKCGIVAAPGDVKTLAEGITRLLNDRAELQQLGLNGFASVMAYDRSTVLSGFLQKIVATAANMGTK